MEKKENLARRGFFGIGLVGLGGAGGWLARKFQGPEVMRKPTPLNDRKHLEYDISEFEKVDPAVIKYNPNGEFATGLESVKRLDAAPDGRVVVAGDKKIKFFGNGGEEERVIELEDSVHCLHFAGEDDLIVGMTNRIEIYDIEGNRKLQGPHMAERTFLTAIATNDDAIFLADAGNREVFVCDRKTGQSQYSFGKKDIEKSNPGFAIPSPYFDLAIDGDGRLRVANTGRLQVETYTLEGEFHSSWGEPGMRVGKFCGCCNPVYFTLTPEGDFITSEKGLARICIYTSDGEFLGAVAGPDILVEDKELARKACENCSIGAGFDVAMNKQGQVLALDPYRKSVRRFEPKATA